MNVEVTHAEMWELDDEGGGGCTNCGHIQYGCEPDARNYECESCGENTVFGIAELAMMGKLTIK